MWGFSNSSVVTATFLAVAMVGAMERPANATILILRSQNLPQYEEPIASFRDTIGEPTRIVDLSGSRSEAELRVRRAIIKETPSAVYALGARAAVLARSMLPSTPMVFSMVVGWSRYELDRGPVTGVSLELPVETLFTRFKLLLPQLGRIGVISSQQTDPQLLEAARAAAKNLKLTLVEECVDTPDDVAGAYRRMHTGIDALWMLPDPTVVTQASFAYLADRASRDGVAFLGFSENFVRAGALLSVGPSYATMGSQAAVLLSHLIASPSTPPAIQPPLGSELVVNAETARRLGLDLDATAFAMADVVVGRARGQR